MCPRRYLDFAQREENRRGSNCHSIEQEMQSPMNKDFEEEATTWFRTHLLAISLVVSSILTAWRPSFLAFGFETFKGILQFYIEGRFEVDKVYNLKPPMPRDGILPPTIDLESGLGEPSSRKTDFRYVNLPTIENWAVLPLFDELPTALALEGLLDRRSDVVLRDRRKIDETPRRPTKNRRPRPRRSRSTRWMEKESGFK